MNGLVTHIRKTASALLIGLAAISPAVAEESYSFGIVPQFEARKLADIWVPILQELQERTGYEFNMVGSPRIPEFEVAFTAGEFDFAYMNPYHSVMAFDAQGYIPLINDGGRKLFGVLAVQKDAPFQKVGDLDGKVIAFPAPNALGASLLMRAELDSIHGITFTPRYVSTHTSAYLNVVLGEADAAGGVMGTFRSQKSEISDNLRILYETTKMPPHPITAHPRVPVEVRDKVRKAFLDMAATDEGQALLARIPMKSAVMASKEDFQVLKEMNLETTW